MKHIKKTKKWILFLLISPALLIPLFIIMAGISIKEIPHWFIIEIPIIILVSIIIFLLIQPFDYLEKLKRRFLTGWGIYVIFTAIMLTILYYFNYDFFGVFLFMQTVFLLSIFFMRFRLFFPKNKESIEDVNQSNSKI